ncbi:cytochrome c oxidase subunit 4 isoform 1, mitochondrial [Drosophila hydei]|uniref:Cytochrome c oxidase subunit 4 n=1 Tax=Drosophila hydei TaxID=7224 RepID=A0A6J2ST48_DROHY|nr:cytochrome c oxidase subunit 4 isoform 1, mitochondrial [Drosophila hydei]XP_030079315.1 cytochrome c oxidase subunit 4 isoform 1, mitochondrial [Drosophila hydei]
MMNSLRCAGCRLPGAAAAVAAAAAAAKTASPSHLATADLRIFRRFTHHDGTRAMSGTREIVGYGVNGSPNYIDCADFPFPAIRYREVTSEICAMREKELGDWKKLSLEEKKSLYRHSFCQTYSEFQYFTPEWKLAVALGLWSVAIGLIITLLSNAMIYDELPITYDDEHRQAQLRRIIQLQMNPITGISSKWDYSQNKWK